MKQLVSEVSIRWLGVTVLDRLQPIVGLAIALLLGMATTGQGQSTQQAIDAVLPKIVKIYGAGGYKNLESYGSGFIVSADGFIATTWSHLLDAEVITVVLDDGRRYEAELIGAEPRLELAVIKIDALDLPFVNIDRPSQADTGSRVLAFSNMYQVAAGDEPVSVMHGVIAAATQLTLRRGRSTIAYDGPVYVVDAITNNSGAAGGLLTTRAGGPLAMIGRQLRNDESNIWLNYAIPLAELAPVMRQIQTGDFSRSRDPEPSDAPRAYRPVDFGFVMVPDVVARTPAYIDAVQPDSPAAAVGLQPDDLIVFANDRLIQSVRALERDLGGLQVGDDLVIVVRRGGALVTVTLAVPQRKTP